MSELKKGDVVTVPFPDVVSSNTYYIDTVEIETFLLYHPLFPKCLLRIDKSEVNKVTPNIKDSVERGLDFANSNRSYLDYNMQGDLEALSLYFVVNRRFTTNQKSILANICGTIACIKLNNDINAAINLVNKNKVLLDDFNSMWYRNFKELFNGSQPVRAKKQRSSIFNIAGFVMSENAIPTTKGAE